MADTVDAAHLQIQPFSEGGNVSYELKVEKTTAGRRILFVIVLVLFACLDGIAIFRRKVLCKEVSGQKKWINGGNLDDSLYPLAGGLSCSGD